MSVGIGGTDGRGVSTVLAAALLVGVVVLLGTITGIALMSFAAVDDPAPSAAFEYDVDGQDVTITYAGGDALSAERVTVLGAVEERPFTGTVTAGDSVTVRLTGERDVVHVVYRTNDDTNHVLGSYEPAASVLPVAGPITVTLRDEDGDRIESGSVSASGLRATSPGTRGIEGASDPTHRNPSDTASGFRLDLTNVDLAQMHVERVTVDTDAETIGYLRMDDPVRPEACSHRRYAPTGSNAPLCAAVYVGSGAGGHSQSTDGSAELPATLEVDPATSIPRGRSAAVVVYRFQSDQGPAGDHAADVRGHSFTVTFELRGNGDVQTVELSFTVPW